MKKGRAAVLDKRHPFISGAVPEGGVTRGKTAVNRLRRVDYFLCRYDPFLIGREDGDFRNACFIDLGYGSSPVTSLETSIRMRKINPGIKVVGIEIDPERVVSAQAYSDSSLEFRLGGFNIPMNVDKNGMQEKARIIRAFNVLRQYDEESAKKAYNIMSENVVPGGLMIEGTSDLRGSIWAANLMRRSGCNSPDKAWEYEAIVFSTSFVPGFSPLLSE